MKRIKVTVDIEGATKEEVIEQLQELIWEVKRFGVTSGHQRALWRYITPRERAAIAEEYAPRSRTRGAVQSLADAHGWKKSMAMSIIQNLRGQGYLQPTNGNQRPAITAKTLELLGRNAEGHALGS